MADNTAMKADSGMAANAIRDLIIRTTNLHKIYDTGEVQVHARRGRRPGFIRRRH